MGRKGKQHKTSKGRKHHTRSALRQEARAYQAAKKRQRLDTAQDVKPGNGEGGSSVAAGPETDQATSPEVKSLEAKTEAEPQSNNAAASSSTGSVDPACALPAGGTAADPPGSPSDSDVWTFSPDFGAGGESCE